ncbi:MAG: helix-turn-helix domain-containing protein [Candidatus Limnocylindria bacterium]
MPAVIRMLDEARRRSDQLRRRLGDELRQARLQAGLSQAAVARALGCSASTISRIERGLVRTVAIEHLMRHAAVVGLVVRADMLPVGAPMRDAGQLRVVNRLEPHVRAPFKWILEMLVGPRDLRAFDAGAIQPGCRIGFDVWSRVRDVQAQARASQRKQLDAGVDRLILVFGDTWANRRAVREAGAALHRAFPLSSRQVLGALRAGRDPGDNGIVVI